LGLSLAFAITATAGASAATLYVSNSAPVVAHGASCAQPDFNGVQAAITAGGANAKISVCPGTYTEQLSITKPVKLSAASGPGTATVAMPSTPAHSTTPCDTLDGLEQIDEVSICASGTVSITGLEIEAIVPLTGCGVGLNGIFVGEGILKATNVVVNGATTSIASERGCQIGIAITVGSIEPTEVAHAVLKGVTVLGYEKNGPTVSGKDSTMIVENSTVTGEGPDAYTAQNGIQVGFGGEGTIKSTTVSGNECNLPSICGASGEQASGVLFYGAAPGSSISSSTVKENDLGAYYGSASKTQPAAPEVTFTKDVLTSNRYEGFVLEGGKALLSKDTINGSGDVGIELEQYEGQLASESSATHTKVEDQTEAAIKVESDKKPADKEGTFDFTDGTFSGDATVLINESSNFEVVF
jgi:hypothetical protein